MTDDHNEHRAVHAGSKSITAEDLSALVDRCEELTVRLTDVRHKGTGG
jgi:hypothetical protein